MLADTFDKHEVRYGTGFATPPPTERRDPVEGHLRRERSEGRGQVSRESAPASAQPPPEDDGSRTAGVGRFVGEYAFLSNFWVSPLTIDGITFPTVEHAFQASKTFDAEERTRVASAPTPTAAKRAGRKVKLRPDWEEVKVAIMEDLVRRKFADPELSAKLLETGERELVEGNTWNDRFWGVCRGSGRNELERS